MDFFESQPGWLIEKRTHVRMQKVGVGLVLVVVVFRVGLAALALLKVPIPVRDRNVKTTTEKKKGGLSIHVRATSLRNAPPVAPKLPVDLDFILPPLVLPHSFKTGESDIAGSQKKEEEKSKVKRTSGRPRESNAPDFITGMNIITEEWLMSQMFGAEMAYGALQLILLDIPAPKTNAFLPVDLDEEGIDALRLCPVPTPEPIRRNCHQRTRLQGTEIGLEVFIDKGLRGTDGGDEGPHGSLHLGLVVQTLETERLVSRDDLRFGGSCCA